MPGPYTTPRSASKSFLNLVSGMKASATSLSDDKLEKRRATNRRSQQKARENKESLIRKLQEENERLRESLTSKASTHDPPSYTSSASPPPSLSHSLPASSVQSPLTPEQHIGVASVDLDACREGFMAVLASVCDPHLNTIHAVCQKFSQSRGQAPPGPNLNPPRPVDRPLNIWRLYSSSPDSNDASTSQISSGSSQEFIDLDFSNLNPPSAYVPPLGAAGPLYVPFLEPAHPTFDLEMDATEIWKCVLGVVDMSRTDAEHLASKITEKVRCYGFGPVVLKLDVLSVCEAFPRLVVDFV